MPREYRIRFLPSDRIFPAEDGDNLLETAMKAGVHINASCGGRGVCGKCKVRLVSGNVHMTDHSPLSAKEQELGFRLACGSTITDDLTVEIPLESQIDRSVLSRPAILSDTQAYAIQNSLVGTYGFEPPVSRYYLELPVPDIRDNVPDSARIIRDLVPRSGSREPVISLDVLRGMGKLLRESGWKITVNVSGTGDMRQVESIAGNNRENAHYAIAMDIGTTTVTAELVAISRDDRSLKVIATASDYNRQISYGEDVISRIMYCRKRGGLTRLHEIIAETLNTLIMEITDGSGIDPEDISHVFIAGNTTMMHLFYGVDPRYIMLEPYTPATNVFPPVRAGHVGLKTGRNALLYSFPGVASYVGGDIVSGVALSGMSENESISLFMDIGTNGEIALGNNEWLLCASCSAGPAFEGGGIRFGMRASPGAIEKVSINPDTLEPMLLTIGRQSPLGICGSGLIDLVAELSTAGIIHRNGKFAPEKTGKHVRQGNSGMEYVVCFASESGIGEDIVITEVDLDNILRTKAAVYAGCRVLLQNGGISFSEIESIIIAGGFGHSIDIEKAITIGLLPEVPVERFRFMGNASLGGARVACVSRGFFEKAAAISRSMTNIELSNNGQFMDEFMAAIFLPHTDDRAFPDTLKKFRVHV